MFDRNLLKVGGMRGVLAALAASALGQALLIIAQFFTLSSAIVAFWNGSRADEALHWVLLFFLSFASLRVVRFVQDCVLDRASGAQAHELNEMLIQRTFDGRCMIARKHGSAAVASAMTDGIEEVQAYLRLVPPKIMGIAGVSIPLLVCVFAIDWISGLILLVMFPVIFFFMMLIGKQARERSQKQYASYTRLTNHFMDTLRGLKTIKAFGASEQESLSVYEQSEKLRNATMRTLATATLSSAVLDYCATFGVAAVAMMLAFRLMDGSVSLWTALVSLMLAPEFFNPIRAFAGDFHASLDGKNALAAILELISKDAEEPRRNAGAEEAESARAPVSLRFDDVAYTYREGNCGLHGVSFAVEQPAKVGVVGPSGSGKSTFADLVAGFSTPQVGTVHVNGTPCDLADPAWKRRVRYIPQHPYIFRDSLERNIAFYRPDATHDEVLKAARAVGLGPLVDELPDGLRTEIGDGARELSGGEAHRVALARVLIDDAADVLVFDEPTAHLDIETELDLRAPMLKAMDNKLVFFATHRMHWLDDMDIVLALDEGRIVSEERRHG